MKPQVIDLWFFFYIWRNWYTYSEY